MVVWSAKHLKNVVQYFAKQRSSGQWIAWPVTGNFTLNLQLENKLALVSGSTAGIGLAIAKALAAEGARVIVNGRSEARVKEAIASIRASVPTAKLEGLRLICPKPTRQRKLQNAIPMWIFSWTTWAFMKSRTLNKSPTRNGWRSLKPIF
jgi:Short-chain alcohol dehydrogenase of unknown specificity